MSNSSDVGPRGNSLVLEVYLKENSNSELVRKVNNDSYMPSPPTLNDKIDLNALFNSIKGLRVAELEGEDVD
jgi:hypothetical protein